MGSLQIIQWIFVARLVASGHCEVIVEACLPSLACKQYDRHTVELEIAYGFNKPDYRAKSRFFRRHFHGLE